jgi:polyferredoxin
MDVRFIMDGRPPARLIVQLARRRRARRGAIRPRIVLYPLLLVLVWGGLVFALTHRAPADVTVLRGLGPPYSILPSGLVSNQIRIKIVNRDSVDRRYRIDVERGDARPGRALEMISPENPILVAAGKSATATVFVEAPVSAFHDGRLAVRFRIGDGADWSDAVPYRLLGPEDHEDHDERKRHGDEKNARR